MVQPQPKVTVSGLYSGDSSTPMTATLRRMPINPLARPSCRRIVPIQSPTLVPVQSSPPPPPLPPTPPPRTDGRTVSSANSNHKISSNSNNNEEPHQQRTFSGHSAWPADASLPRRVKKLSWEDEFNVFF